MSVRISSCSHKSPKTVLCQNEILLKKCHFLQNQIFTKNIKFVVVVVS